MLFLEEVYQDVGMRSRGIREQALTIENEKFVYTIRKNLLFHITLDACTCNNSVKLYTKFIGQLAALCQKFLRNLLHLSALDFAINKYVIHNLRLANDFFVQQFFYQILDVSIATCKSLALLSLKNNILNSLYLGR